MKREILVIDIQSRRPFGVLRENNKIVAVDPDNYGEDGRVYKNGKPTDEYWYGRLPSDNALTLRGDRWNNIKYLETIRWKILGHIKSHLSRKYREAIERVRDGKGSRFEWQGKVYEVRIREHDPQAADQHIIVGTRPMDKLAMVPMEGVETWESGLAWKRSSLALQQAWNRVGTVNNLLSDAMDRYMRDNYTGELFSEPRKISSLFIINGRYYKWQNSGPSLSRTDRWQCVDDIVIKIE